MKYIVFSVDRIERTGILSRFLNYVDSCKACGSIKNNVIQCIGSYKGILEVSFIMRLDDFNSAIRDSGLVSDQDSFLEVSECNKRYCDLVFQATGDRVGLGSLKSVPWGEAKEHDSWTYRPDMGEYWVTIKGNPDTYVGD